MAACCPPQCGRRPLHAAGVRPAERRHPCRRNAVHPARGHGRWRVATHGPDTRVVGRARLHLPGRASRHRPGRVGPVACGQRLGARRPPRHSPTGSSRTPSGWPSGWPSWPHDRPRPGRGRPDRGPPTDPLPGYLHVARHCPGAAARPDRDGPSWRRAPGAGGERDGSALRSGHRAPASGPTTCRPPAGMARPASGRSPRPGKSPPTSGSRPRPFRYSHPEP